MSAAWVAAPVLWLSLVNATLCTVLPIVLVMSAVQRLGAGPDAQFGLLGPLSTIVMGVWWLDEPLTWWLGLSTALVLAGIYVFSRGAGAVRR